MAIEAVKLRITPPAGATAPGGGFYQVEEDRLFVQVGLASTDRHFYSFLDSRRIRLDFDREARLLFVDVRTPRRHWPIVKDLIPPERCEPADVRWLDFRETIPPVTLAANPDKTILRLQFSHERPVRTISLADRVTLQSDARGFLVALWIDGIVDDMGGRTLAAFRRHCLKSISA